MSEIDDYLARQPDDVRATLESLRRTIREAAPEANEALVYQLPAFKYHGHLVGFAAQAKHCSFYIMSPSLAKSLKDSIKPFKLSGATIHFSPENPLPEALVKKIVKARMKENEDRKKLK